MSIPNLDLTPQDLPIEFPRTASLPYKYLKGEMGMDLKSFLLNQKEEALKYKFIKGQKIGHDPGEEAVIEWVNKYAKQYREEYNEVYSEMIHQCAQKCMDKLRKKVPGISEELWGFIFAEIIDAFTAEWTKEVCCEKDESRRIHITEI